LRATRISLVLNPGYNRLAHRERPHVDRRVKSLPEPLAREVLDFVGYLRERQERADWRDLMNAQAGSLAPVWDNAEDKVWMATATSLRCPSPLARRASTLLHCLQPTLSADRSRRQAGYARTASSH
jgi:hypothetical protein